MLAATKDSTYPVTPFYFLFIHNPQRLYTSLFIFNNLSFFHQYIVNNLQARLLAKKVIIVRFFGP